MGSNFNRVRCLDVVTRPCTILQSNILRRMQSTVVNVESSTPPLDPSSRHNNPRIAFRTQAPKQIVLKGRVISAGQMDKTVRVARAGVEWHNYLRKFYSRPQRYLVRDPASSLRLHDQISFTPLSSSSSSSLSSSTTNRVKHIVKEILVPYGTPLSSRPAIPSLENVDEKLHEKSAARSERRRLRKAAVDGDEKAMQEVKRLGINVKRIVSSRSGKIVGTVLERDVMVTKEGGGGVVKSRVARGRIVDGEDITGPKRKVKP